MTRINQKRQIHCLTFLPFVLFAMEKPSSIDYDEGHYPLIKHEFADEENGYSISSSFSSNSTNSISLSKSRDESETIEGETAVSEDESNNSVVIVDLCSEDNFEVSVLSSPIADLSSKAGKTVSTLHSEAENKRDFSSRASLANRDLSKSIDTCVVEIMDSPAAVSANPYASRKRKNPWPQPSEIHVVDDDQLVPAKITDSLQDNDRSQVASTVVRPFSCPICLEDVPRGGQACILGCGHRLCFGCAGSFVTLKVQEAQVCRLLFSRTFLIAAVCF